MIGGPGSRGPGARSGSGRRPRQPALWIVIAAGVAFVVAVVAAVAAAIIIEQDSPCRSDTATMADVLPAKHWQKRFDAHADTLYERSLDESESADSWDYYQLAYGIDAYTAMYQATGETRYLDTTLELIANMVSDARPSSSIETSQYRDRYLAWTSERKDVRGQEVPLFESYNWRYVTRTLRVMRQTPAIYDDPAYRAQYERLLNFTEVNIFEKWYARGTDETIYRSRTHMAAHWAYIAVDLFTLTADEARRVRYQEVFSNIDRDLPNHSSSLRDQLQLQTTVCDQPAYFWSPVWDGSQRRRQDVSHGNGVIAYVVEAHELGSEWTATDMARFSATLTELILHDGGASAEYVDGTGDGRGGFADGFVKLGRFDPAVQTLLQEHGVQNAHYYAGMALNAAVLHIGRS
jgi:hypothetical protein